MSVGAVVRLNDGAHVLDLSGCGGEGCFVGGDVHVQLCLTVAADEHAYLERGSRLVVGRTHDAHRRLTGVLSQKTRLMLVEVDRLVDGIDACGQDAGLFRDVGVERAIHVFARELGAK